MINPLTFINTASLFALLLAGVISFSRNSDIFSPIKIYCVFSFFFYFDIYLGNYNAYVCFIYLTQNLALLLCATYEPKIKASDWHTTQTNKANPRSVIILVWFLSTIPVASQLAIIYELGGYLGALKNIAVRVKYFQGKGYLLILNSFFVALNLIYFCAIINKPKPKQLFFYSAHFSFLVVIALLSGSRSFVIMPILVMLIISNYFFRRTSIKIATIFLLLIVLAASILGALRNTISVDDQEVSFERFSGSDKVELTHFKYGLIPLSIITNSEVSELQYGKTYLSLITNFIPRSIYPDKFESGGVYFTKKYADDAWDGYSNLATGAVTEGIINFGLFFGSIVGVLGILAFYLAGIKSYCFFLLKRNSGTSFFIAVPYIYFVLLAARYSYSEFSYIIFSYISSIALPCAAFWFLYTRIIIRPE